MAKAHQVTSRAQQAFERFAGELEAILREEALAVVTSSLQTPRVGAKVYPNRIVTGKVARRAKPAAGAKRTPAELASLTEAVLSHVRENHAQNVEQIAAALEVSTRELVLPLAKLLESKQISKKGQRRATRYSAR